MKTNLYKFPLLFVAAIVLILNACKKEIITAPQKSLALSQNMQTGAKERMYFFPGHGWVPASKVNIVERGYYLLKQNGHIYKVEKASNKIVLDYGELKKPDINKPSVQPKFVSNAAAFLPSAAISNKNRGPEFSATNNNWIDYAYWKNPQKSTPINYFATTWKVPSAPDSIAGQSIAIFNGLEDTTTYGDVIQPVLGWGPQADGPNCNCWYINNTYATASPTPYYFSSSSDTVYSNTSITGIIKFKGYHSPDLSYNYTSLFSGYADSLVLVEGTDFTTVPSHEFAPAIPELNLACITLEAYTLGNHAVPQYSKLYPLQDSIPMKSINLKVSSSHPTITWTTATSPDTIAGEKAVVISNSNPGGEVDLYFHGKLTYPIISYTSPDVYTVGTGITSLSPTNTGGTPTSYSVSPALPAGLSLNTSTGVITGTPTATSAQATYTVTATNSSGTGTFPIIITVNPHAPVISYTTPNTYYTGFPITSLNPTNTGGAATSYSVSPALPSGLSLNTTTGVISGTPNAAIASAGYTVTATNAGGSGNFTVYITITASYSITFNVSSTNSSIDDFSLWVSGVNESGPRGVDQASPISITGYGYSSSSTVVMEFTSGPMPTSAQIQSFWGPVTGVISGSNITFSGCNLSTTQGSVDITIN